MKSTNLLSKPIGKIKAAAPEIAIVSGIGLIIFGTVKACQATRKLDAILEEHKNAVEEIKEDSFDDRDLRKEVTMQYGRTAWEIFRIYAPSVAIGSVGVFLIFKGHGILRRRYIALVSAYSMLEKSYDMYRKRVINEFGEAMDRHFRFGMQEEEVEYTETSKTGKEKTVKKKVNTIDPDFEKYSPYARVFDEFNHEWNPDPGLNKAFILSMQNWANDILVSRKKLFLNEVYRMLGFKETKAGQKAGWIWKDDQEDGDNFVDFGINEVYKRAAHGDEFAAMWVNGIEPSILLDFNCKGNIVDEAFDEEI